MVLLAVALAAGCGRSGAPQFKLTDVTGASFGKSLELTDHNGQRRTLADFKGKVVAIFFGFTHCPDVCPTTLVELANVARELGADAHAHAGAFRDGRSRARHAAGPAAVRAVVQSRVSGALRHAGGNGPRRERVQGLSPEAAGRGGATASITRPGRSSSTAKGGCGSSRNTGPVHRRSCTTSACFSRSSDWECCNARLLFRRR